LIHLLQELLLAVLPRCRQLLNLDC
jgi:hypothetical protein